MLKPILSAIFCFCLCLAISTTSSFAEELAKFNANGWDITFRSMVSLNWYSTNDSEEVPNGKSISVDDTTFSPGDSRLNMRFNKDAWRGCFEVRNRGVELEKEPLHFYWTEYNFNVGRILVGRDMAPSKLPLLNPPPVKSGLGQLIGHKPAPMIRLTFPIGNTGTEWLIAALQQDDWIKSRNGGRLVPGAVEDHHDLPSIETRLDVPWGNFNFNFLATYEDYYELTSDNKEYSFPSYLYGVCAKYRISKFLFEGSVFKDHNNYSHNGDPRQKGYMFSRGAYGNSYYSDYYGDPKYDKATDSVIESDYLGWAIAVNYFMNEKVSLHAGFSQGRTEDDLGNKDPSIGYEFYAIFNIAKHLRIIPFFNVADWQDRQPVGRASIEEGKTTKIGLKTQILFW